METQRIVKITALIIGAIVLSSAASAETIRIGGTGMVLGLLQALKGPFERYSPQDQLIVVPGLGSGAGIAALADSALSASASARPLKKKESAKNLILHPFIETPFVFISNTRSNLSFSSPELVGIFSGEKTYLGEGLRARIILRPTGDSVTTILEREIPDMKKALKTARAIQGIPVAQTDQDNMKLAQKMAGSITAMTMTQFKTEPNSLHMIKVDGFDAKQAIAGTGSYPYYMTAWIVTHKNISSEVQRFLDFLDTPEAAVVYQSSGALRAD
ncbi:substrate-binding domain-containing protein [Cohaesibacter celericrescens]|uniref:substrate-binding domain-containing protein n=1 Tax=Cohaesibacter celericrescens TaxID=2067669 RepID=UPI003562DB17